MDANRGYHRLRISSLTLQSLGVSDACSYVEGKLEEVIIENAPLLERLTPPCIRNEGFVIWVTQAPKLKTLGYLSHKISTIELGTMVFQVAAYIYAVVISIFWYVISSHSHTFHSLYPFSETGSC